MSSKTKIYNLAANALLLQTTIANVDTDTSQTKIILDVNYDMALLATLEDLDLDGTSETKVLELRMNDPNNLWSFAYKYPTNCAMMRRIVSGALKDDRSSLVPKSTGILNAEKVIFTNKAEASLEYIPSNIPLTTLSANTILAIAYKLAHMSAPLIVGKNAIQLRHSIAENYILAKANAQEHDRIENTNYDDPSTQSEFVRERLS